MPTAAAKSTLLVSTDEIEELARWEKKYSFANKKLGEAKRELDFRRQALAEKVLGVNSTDDLKKLSPDQIVKISAKRFAAGDWKPERGCPEFEFKQTSAGRYPAWSQLYVAELGETAAARVRTETPLTHSYMVEVSPA
jgi:hypothetical protein